MWLVAAQILWLRVDMARHSAGAASSQSHSVQDHWWLWQQVSHCVASVSQAERDELTAELARARADIRHLRAQAESVARRVSMDADGVHYQHQRDLRAAESEWFSWDFLMDISKGWHHHHHHLHHRHRHRHRLHLQLQLQLRLRLRLRRRLSH